MRAFLGPLNESLPPPPQEKEKYLYKVLNTVQCTSLAEVSTEYKKYRIKQIRNSARYSMDRSTRRGYKKGCTVQHSEALRIVHSTQYRQAQKYYTSTLIKKKIEFSSYIGRFRVEQLQSHI
jgi:hypothetical protein